MPYPFQQGTHQSDNARALVALGKALVVEESGPEFGRRLREALEKILAPESFRSMKRATCELHGLEAAQTIARGIVAMTARP